MKKPMIAITTLLMVCAVQVQAMSDAELQAITEQRLLGDRTGACFAVAVIEKTVSRAFVCANPDDRIRIGKSTAFEIGSITKTMTSALLADLILQGKASLNDPLQAYLPNGIKAPEFNAQPILLRHLVTHTSGLPVIPDFSSAKSISNPYAQVTEQSILKTLSKTTLTRAPGSQFEYSNYASMLLSLLISRRAGEDYVPLLKSKLFEPAGMQTAYVTQAPRGISAAKGHLPNGQVTSAWDFDGNLSGVGGVRATLDDMVAYMQAQLGQSKSAISPALHMTQQPLPTDSGRPMAMNWMLAPLDGRQVHVHEGGTGGFSALAMFDLEKQKAVVVLSDTALTSVGGLSSLGNHLLDERLPLGAARKIATPAPELLEALAGVYSIMPDMQMVLRARNGHLYIQATGQPEFEMGYDSAGDFFPLSFDALLRVVKTPSGDYGLTLMQGGGAMPLRKVNEVKRPGLTAAQLQAYAGTYAITSAFALKVFTEGGVLMAQATGQGAFPLDPAGNDVFTAVAFGIEIRFIRSESGVVVALELLQGGQRLKGVKN